MRKGFTLIELVVAVAILAMVISFSTVVFKVSIKAHRIASANMEIMQKMRAITDQLNRDFGGLQTDASLLIWFSKDGENLDDRIMFFANGDFQSTQLYNGTSGEPDENGNTLLVGNSARIFYGRAGQLLARRQHILTADEDIEEWPDIDMSNFDRPQNEWYEHDHLSLAEWKIVEADKYGSQIIPTCFVGQPMLDLEVPSTFHKLMCEGVGSFAVQWAYWDEDDDRFYWFPSENPDGDGSDSDSHFNSIGDEFGVYFNVPGSVSIIDWYNPFADAKFAGEDFALYPKAIKFSFTIYDSRGVIEKGRRFTHIVYLLD